MQATIFARISRILVLTLAAVGFAWSAPAASAQNGAPKVLQIPMRTDGPKSLDPVEGSTTYDNMACVQIYETLLENKYSDPYKQEPRLLAEMPTTEDNGKTWRFKLKQGVVFYDPYNHADGPLFNGSRTREVTTDDVFYSLKRVADERNGLKNWWLLKDTILGFDAWKDEQNARLNDGDESSTFDYDAPVEGFRKINDREFEIELAEPVYRFLWVLSMFQTSVVPREAVERYGKDFSFHPVGTGPFVLDRWVPKQRLNLNRNPRYHEVRYPDRDEWSRDDRRLRLHRPAGEQVPFVDRLEFTMFVEDQPMWLQFRKGNIGYTEVPAEYFEEAFDKRTRQLKSEMVREGLSAHSNKLLDFIFRGFNMEDPVLGGYDDKRKALRQAISLATDLDEFNKTFYNGLVVVYDGPIPPGLDGHPENGSAPVSYRGPSLELARKKLAEAGYPNGDGLAPIKFYVNRGGNSPEQVEMMRRQLAQIGVELDPQLVDFSTLIEFVNNKKAPMFSFAWSSDYPDAENNLALFYTPNMSPGSNHFNYSRPEYDEMYERILTMAPGEERTAIYERMRDMVIEDTPYVGSMARERFYLINPWMLNARPTERYYSWFKYIDVDNSKRPR